MKTVKITYRFANVTSEHAADFIKRLYSVGAVKCEPSGDGAVYVIVAEFPVLNEYDAAAFEAA